MKILQINNSYNKVGGAESVFFNTIALLKQNGHEVVPFSLNSSKNLDSKYSSYFVDDVKPLHNKLFSFTAQKKLAELINVEKPDIAHIHNIIGGLTFSIIPVLRKMGIPIVASIHDFRLLCPAFIFINGKKEVCEKCKGGKYFNCIINNCSPEGLLRSSLIATESYFRDYFYPFSKNIDAFIFVSKFVQNKFMESNPELHNKSYLVYNFTNRMNLNSEMGKYFLFIGRLAREKSLFTLLDSFRLVPRLKLKIVGEGDLKKELELKKSSNVELVGYKTGNELLDQIKNASFIIASSECYETNSMVTLESYSLGKPVLGSDIGAISELIIDGKTGFLYEPKNCKELSNKLSECSEMNPSSYAEMSNNAFDFLEERFSSKLHYTQLIKVYENTLNNRN
jgi:glycosyltransferase involved in cell wall biosynthesis